MNWQDIKDAPKDGTIVTLGCEEGGGITLEVQGMYWSDKGYWVHKDGRCTWSVGCMGEPTHFSLQKINN